VSDDRSPLPLVIIGGGISGLSAAWFALESGGFAPDEVLLLEGSPRTGGKLLRGELGARNGDPVRFDLGAESTLARRPEAVDLIRAAGLGDDLVQPAVFAASVLARGQLHRMPGGTVMGVPNDPATLQGLLDGDELQRVAAEPEIPAPALDHDVAVGSWVTERFGRAVADRLVEPLLGGVYAGHADRLSLQATVPALWSLARAGGSVLGHLPVPGPSASATAAFAGVRGGVARLAEVLTERLLARGVRIRTGTTVRALARSGNGWRVETGPAPAPEFMDAQRVLIAVPPPAAARLLRDECAPAARELAEIPMASMAVIAALVPSEQVASLPVLAGSGLLVPPSEGRLIKAATFTSSKWAWAGEAAGRDVLIRLSIGRQGEERDLQLPDDELARRAIADLGSIIGRELTPSSHLVQRWGGGLPQYEVGHVDRVRRIRDAVAARPGLAICGAAFDGVGIPACIAAARRAAGDLVRDRSAEQGRIDA